MAPYVNGDLEYAEDGRPTGRIVVFEPLPGEVSVVMARIQIGDLEHAWEVGRVTDEQTTFDIVVPPDGIFTSLQELAFSYLYVSIQRTLVDREVDEEHMVNLAVVWIGGLDEDPDVYTASQAQQLWPGGVVGVEAPPGWDIHQPADSVRAWIEAYD